MSDFSAIYVDGNGHGGSAMHSETTSALTRTLAPPMKPSPHRLPDG